MNLLFSTFNWTAFKLPLTRHNSKIMEQILDAGTTSDHLTLSSVARERVRLTNSKFRAKVKQLCRFCDKDPSTVRDLNAAWIKFITRELRVVVISLDWSQFRNRWVLTASIYYMGRSIPLWHTSLPKNGRKNMETACEWAVLLRIMSIFEPSQSVIVCADRGFLKTDFFSFRHWPNLHLIIRLKSNTLIKYNDITQHARDFSLKKDERLILKDTQITGMKVDCSVLLFWRDDCKEPIYLAGDPRIIETLDILYAKRTGIECMFRDEKYRGNLHWSNFKTVDRARMWQLIVSMIFVYRALLVQQHHSRALDYMRKYCDYRKDLCFLELGKLLGREKLKLIEGQVYLSPDEELEKIILK